MNLTSLPVTRLELPTEWNSVGISAVMGEFDANGKLIQKQFTLQKSISTRCHDRQNNNTHVYCNECMIRLHYFPVLLNSCTINMSDKNPLENSKESCEENTLFCPSTMVRYDNVSNEYSTLWVCKICITCLLSRQAVERHVINCNNSD
ncbi:hypothetical protein QTP88_028793 [Uroleucon formosanum]